MLINRLVSALCLLCFSCHSMARSWEGEVVYQVFPRSFFDSNADHVGDLKGISAKLPYLQDLGVTCLLINPIFKAREYHNYFADDFFTVDPSLGTNEDFFRLIKQAHLRHMKVILDMEIQYVADRHPWLADVLINPQSKYRDYVWSKGSAFFDWDIHWWGGARFKIAAINPNLPAVKNYAKDIFRFWAAPNGNAANGVDGFRIDHMMDDLDNKHVMTSMLSNWPNLLATTPNAAKSVIHCLPSMR